MEVTYIAGDGAILDSMLYGRVSRKSIEESSDRLREFRRSVRSDVFDAIDRVETSLDRLLEEDIDDVLRKANKKRSKLWKEDILEFLCNLEEISSATERAQVWLLGNRRLNALFKQQRIQAWGRDPSKAVFEREDGRNPYTDAVYNGAIITDSDGNSYSECIVGGHTVDGETISLETQLELIATYDVIDQYLDDGIDPTNPLGESL